MAQERKFTFKLGEDIITLSTGKLAGQAGGAVVVSSGDTVMLVTATMAKKARAGIDFFPLTVDLEERLYAAGRIPGSFFRREGRPSEQAILLDRVIDRPLRPLFPKDMRNAVQIILLPLSLGKEQLLSALGLIGASAALTISDVPFDGPIAAVRIGSIDEELIINPTISQLKESTLDLLVAGSEEAIIMVEAGAQEIDEETMLDALELAHKSIQDAIRVQHEMREAVGKPKRLDYPSFALPAGLVERVRELTWDCLNEAVEKTTDRDERSEIFEAVEKELRERLAQEEQAVAWSDKQIDEAFHDVMKAVIRERILETGIRPDGRDPRTIRELTAEVDLVPRPHGSGLFSRGLTQVLSLTTLGMPSEEQRLDDLFPGETKRYIHHYNFPPYSTGETWFLRGPKRREIGHGALAARALEPLLPSTEEFPYTIRVVSESLSSNGSTSMASVCGSTLSLMDAGVPLKAPVGGIAMGLVSDGERYRVLTDIQGVEDHLGDMDFKVTGTREGITALQMDIKIKGVTRQILSEALEQARIARLQVLDVIKGAIAAPRPELPENAPKMVTLKIDPEKIGKLIGPGGKTIRAIQEKYEVNVDVEDDGTVFIAAESGRGAEEALVYVNFIMETPQEGKIYTGKVARIVDFGAFVEILPGTDGLVHISQLSDKHIPSVEAVVSVGDEILVMVTGIRRDGKIRLSRQAVLEGWTLEEARSHDRPKTSSRAPRRR
ncbi:MAG TPA: polyribonucleotide nucleotidyltransferase [Thermoflexia bacterium]|nr:polyribonucleotide nucleotidyltransferase [Thermoflexia bacterium]